MSNTPEQSQLGKASSYADQYDASLLFPIARQSKRDEIGVGDRSVFFGADLWTAFELSWLNAKGKPQVAIAHITICLLYTSPSPRDGLLSRMPSSA